MSSGETERKIQQLQLIEQNVQNLLVQKQTFQAQMIEIDSALEQLKGKSHAYRIIGNIMVNSDAKSLSDDLDQKKKLVEIRIKNFEKQEEQLKEKAKKLQSDVLKEMKEK
ncbi:prefoldin subunit [Candidatus Woesearchaeota archaeon]|nr:prefoldin subunit [Candidatus Woesearchaeota archaeon]